MNGGYVYLLGVNGDNELFKIGVTRGSIKNRIKKLQTGNGNQIKCVSHFYSDRPYKLEKMLHNHFNNDREDGEWFLLSEEQVNSFDSLCENYQNVINSLRDNPFF